MHRLLRPDVLPLDDLGLQRAVSLAYCKVRKLSARAIERVAAPWQPWRSVATWYLWRSLDLVPVEYLRCCGGRRGAEGRRGGAEV